MNKVIIPLAMLIAAASSPVFAQAPSTAQNTVTFTGKIYEQACTVVVNKNDPEVALGNYSKARIPDKGSTTDYVSFDVSLTKCPTGDGVPTQAMIRFHGTADEHDTTYFQNSTEGNSGGATGVGVSIRDDKHQDVTNNIDASPINLPSDGSDITVNYYAAMVNDGAGSVTGGDVNTPLTYTVSYN